MKTKFNKALKMKQRYLPLVTQKLLFVALLFCTALQAQPAHIVALEDQVYKFNNALKYTESQKLLMDFINKPTSTPEDKYYANLYFSYTHKRLFDYDKVLKYLDIALSEGMKTAEKDFYVANIQCQKALVYFDIHKYPLSDSIMQILSKNKYNYLNEEYQAKIIMQEAYLSYLRKDYTVSEKKYDQALVLLRGSSPCDLPMIYGKKMQLYTKMGDDAKVEEAYQRSLFYADSCKILKYTMYTKEILVTILSEKKGMGVLLHEVDSLHNFYKEKDRLKELEDVEKKYQESLHEIELKNKQQQIFLLSTIAVGLLFILVVMGYFLWFIRKQRNVISQQNELNEQTIAILSHDIKEPLLGVKLLLKKLNTNDPFVAQASQSLEGQINAVNGILTNLLKMKKLSLTKKDKNATASATAVVNNVIKELNVAIQNKGLTVHNELNAEVMLPIAPEKLQIIVHNLLSNAVKYSFPNQSIRIFKEGRGFSIQDFGIGLSPEQRTKLMREVTASEHGTNQERGNGLGLFLVGALLQGEQLRVVFDAPEVGGTIVKVLG
jgi:signal transduction histidine kinase